MVKRLEWLPERASSDWLGARAGELAAFLRAPLSLYTHSQQRRRSPFADSGPPSVLPSPPASHPP